MTEQDFLNPTGDTVRKAISENVKLSPSFRLGEFLISQTAARKGIDNVPGPEELKNLYLLCKYTLQPVRDFIGKQVLVSSGLRVTALNKAVGGKPRSSHIKGQAADIVFYGTDQPLEEIANRIVKSAIPFYQLILEFHYMSSPESGWIHLSYVHGTPLRQVLTIDRHGTRIGLDPADF